MELMREASRGTLSDHLGIELVELSKERVVARMPVERRVHQPFGLLHGGASVVLAETVASIGAWMNAHEAGKSAVGLEINANHLRGKRDGVVTATATPLHLGRATHVWEIRLTDEAGRLLCISRCTMALVDP
ncbi:MAG: hotdog fold thioesterase [Myxococcaceae bacterium]|nr:hotdog fold thioesterase [Myxococcaceae bacterium]MCA3011988.1 hotdog fold thioesterase [Myxococcaceae bacterium]